MFHKRALGVVLAAGLFVIVAAALAWWLWLTPIDAITVKESRINIDKLNFVIRLEKESGAIDSLVEYRRRYIPIVGHTKYCILAFFDPPIPINQNGDDVYCFNLENGSYEGKL